MVTNIYNLIRNLTSFTNLKNSLQVKLKVVTIFSSALMSSTDSIRIKYERNFFKYVRPGTEINKVKIRESPISTATWQP